MPGTGLTTANYLIQTCNATISLLASLVILIMIGMSTKKLSTPYRRLIFGMSVGDILLSGALVTGPFAIPAGSPNANWSRGNVSSCDTNGFFMVLGSMAVPLYTYALSLHYLCKLNFKMTEDVFYKKIEKKLHCVMCVFLLVISVTGLVLNVYGQIPSGSFCSFSQNRCGEGGFVGSGSGSGNGTNVVNNVEYAAAGTTGAGTTTDDTSTSANANVSTASAENIVVDDYVCKNGKGFEPLVYLFVSVIFLSFAGIITNMTMLCAKSCTIERMFRSQAGDPQNFTDYNCIEHYLLCLPCRHHQQLAHEADADYVLRLYKRETIIQSCLYVGAFFTSHFGPICGIIGSQIDFPLELVSSFVYPLGGFFNILVYTRPKVVRLLYLYPDLSRMAALCLVIQNGGEMPEIPLQPGSSCCICNLLNNIGTDNSSLCESDEPDSSHAFQVRMMLRDYSD